MDGPIMRCGIISLCQSAATSEIVKRSWVCIHRGAALYQVPDLYLQKLLWYPKIHCRREACELLAENDGRKNDIPERTAVTKE